MLAIIADTFANSFVQVSRTTGGETTILTADAAGHSQIFYQPNDELGYIDPATGNLLTLDSFTGTSSVPVIDAHVAIDEFNTHAIINISDLVGVTYNNGQLVATNGGLTVYHRDGSIMRSGGVWTYDAGATLENASGNYFWSNGNQMLTGTLAYHANGAALRNASNSLFYAGGAMFNNATTGTLAYVGGQPLRNAAGDYFYTSGTAFKTTSTNTIRYSNNTVMVDSAGSVYNDTGALTFAPFTRTQDIGSSEYYTHVESQQSDTVFSTSNVVSGEVGAYVSKFHITYQVLPPNPLSIGVVALSPTSLRFTWTAGGGTTTGYRVAVANGVSPPGDPASAADTSNNYYDVTGLAAGQKVSIRVWANDGSGHLSSGVFATGTAGRAQQTAQTGELLASSLETTFVQAYDTYLRNVIYSVDSADNFFAIEYVNDDIGYVNLANGDRLQHNPDPDATDVYQVPMTISLEPSVLDFHVVGNLAQIPSGARYLNGTLVRSGGTYYYDNGAVLRDAAGNWFYSDGTAMQTSIANYWPSGTVAMHSGTTSHYPDNTILKSGTTIFYQGGGIFNFPNGAAYPDGTILKDSKGNMFNEVGVQLLNGNRFRYGPGGTMIDASGTPFYVNGQPADFPFEYTDVFSYTNPHVGESDDRIARYAIVVQTSSTAVHVLGGTVDYHALSGDFNRDGTADTADYVLWRKNVGSTYDLAADANANGTVDSADLAYWRVKFGSAPDDVGDAPFTAFSPWPRYHSTFSTLALSGTATGAVDSADDDDWFGYSTAESAGYVFRVSVTPSGNNDVALRIVDVDGVTVLASDTDGGAASIVWRAPTGGNYYFVVSGVGGSTGGYTISYARDDYGDSAPLARSLVNDLAVTGAAGVIWMSSDTDWFQTSVNSQHLGRQWQISVALGSLPNAVVRIYDADGVTQLAADADGGAGTVVWTPPAVGSYYIEVAGLAGATGSYLVRIGIDDDHDNAPVFATPVAVPSTKNGIISEGWGYYPDVDWYSFTAVAGTTYRIQVTGNNYASLELYDRDGITLLGLLNPLVWTAPSSGTYFFNVNEVAFNANNESYQVSISILSPPAAGASDDERLTNSVQATGPAVRAEAKTTIAQFLSTTRLATADNRVPRINLADVDEEVAPSTNLLMLERFSGPQAFTADIDDIDSALLSDDRDKQATAIVAADTAFELLGTDKRMGL